MARQKPVTIVRKARALLAKGWCQMHLHQARKGVDLYCAQAALSMAATGDPWRSYPEMDHLWAVLNRLAREREPALSPNECCALTVYNDTAGRTQAEVVALFDQAIRELSAP